MRREERKREDAELGALHSSDQKLKGEEDRLLDAYAKGIIDIDQLQGRMTTIRQQKAALQKVRVEVDERAQEHQRVEGDIATVRAFCKRAQAGLPYLPVEERRAFLEAMHTEIRMLSEEDFIFNGLINNITLLYVDAECTQAETTKEGDTGTLVSTPSGQGIHKCTTRPSLAALSKLRKCHAEGERDRKL